MGDFGAVNAQRVGKVGVAESIEHDVRSRHVDEVGIAVEEGGPAQSGKRGCVLAFDGKVALAGIKFDELVLEGFRLRQADGPPAQRVSDKVMRRNLRVVDDLERDAAAPGEMVRDFRAQRAGAKGQRWIVVRLPKTASATSRSGSAQSSVPAAPKWQKVRGEVRSPVQWRRLLPFTSQPRPQNAGSQVTFMLCTPPRTPWT